ncbi:hypothetical protein PFISCL1PPCAC_1690, partial [Pristionchus fissidentatus]
RKIVPLNPTISILVYPGTLIKQSNRMTSPVLPLLLVLISYNVKTLAHEHTPGQSHIQEIDNVVVKCDEEGQTCDKVWSNSEMDGDCDESCGRSEKKEMEEGEEKKEEIKSHRKSEEHENTARIYCSLFGAIVACGVFRHPFAAIGGFTLVWWLLKEAF